MRAGAPTRSIDVSMPLFEGMPAFPGDPAFSSHPDRAIARGDPYNISRLTLGSHAGTHVDPPVHFLEGAPGIDRIDLDSLNGPCFVAGVGVDRRLVDVTDLVGLPSEVNRVLFRTSNSARWAQRLTFFPDYVALSVAAAEDLLRRKIALVGIDSLSVESDPTDAFPVHHRLLGGGALILEGLLLDGVEPGWYHLECLPLRIRSGDGGPARAVLRPL